MWNPPRWGMVLGKLQAAVMWVAAMVTSMAVELITLGAGSLTAPMAAVELPKKFAPLTVTTMFGELTRAPGGHRPLTTGVPALTLKVTATVTAAMAGLDGVNLMVPE